MRDHTSDSKEASPSWLASLLLHIYLGPATLARSTLTLVSHHLHDYAIGLHHPRVGNTP